MATPPAGKSPDEADPPDTTGAGKRRPRKAGAGGSARKPATDSSGSARKPAGDSAAKPAGKPKPRKPGAGAAGAKAAAGQGAPRKRAAGTPRRKPAPRAAKSGGAAAATADAADQTAVTAASATAAAESGAPAAGARPKPRAAAGGAQAPSTEARAPVSRRAPRVRSWIALILVIMAILTVVVGVVALWSRDLVFDTDTYVKTVAPLADDPQVRHSVSVFVTDKAIAATDLDRRIEDALPSDAKILAAPLTDELRGFLVGEIDEFLGTKLAREIWVDINRFGHSQLIAALRDQNRYVTVGRNDVQLNLLPLVAVALQKLEDQIPRLLGKDVQLPQIDPETAPDQIRTLLQDALGRPLPADFGSITLLRGDQGYEAKQALRLFNDLVILVIILAVVLVVAALLVSVRKWRTTLQLGLGALLGFVAARVIERQLETAIVDAVKSEGGAAMARAIVNSAIDSLNGFFVWVAVAGAIVAVTAFLAGRPDWVQAMGRGFAKLFGVASDLSAPDTRAGRWVALHLDTLRIGGVAAGVVALFFVAGSLAAVLVVVIALVVYELTLSAYAAGLPRPTDGQTPPPSS